MCLKLHVLEAAVDAKDVDSGVIIVYINVFQSQLQQTLFFCCLDD